MTAEDLNKLSKDELEELGRTKGVELDRRLTKPKLVKQISKLFTSKTSEATIREQILAKHPNWNEKLIGREIAKRLEEENK
tara:strand:+ start:621 stop:863 length:243 start_codon:yes stop_codon:yes gene_type:complete